MTFNEWVELREAFSREAFMGHIANKDIAAVAEEIKRLEDYEYLKPGFEPMAKGETPPPNWHLEVFTNAGWTPEDFSELYRLLWGELPERAEKEQAEKERPRFGIPDWAKGLQEKPQTWRQRFSSS